MTNTPRYSFPNISFDERIVGPLPSETSWRSRVGVAGVFRRGPRGAVRINNRQDFNSLFAEDNSPGAIFVRQLMLQGVTDITISRAVPEPSKSTIEFAAPGLIESQEAQIGYLGNLVEYDQQNRPIKTTGLEMRLAYVGNALASNPGAGSLTVKAQSQLSTDFQFEGKANIDLYVEDYLEGSQALTLAQAYNAGYSSSHTATTRIELSVGQTGLANSLPLSHSQAPTDGTTVLFPSGVWINFVTDLGSSALTYTVLEPGTIDTGDIGYSIKALQLTSIPSQLNQFSQISASGILFLAAGSVSPTQAGVEIPVIAMPTQAGISAPTIATGSVLSPTSILTNEATVQVAQSTQITNIGWVFVDNTLPGNASLVANLKPGRVLQSITGNTFQHSVFGETRPGLLIMSTPAPTGQIGQFRVLVQGSVGNSSVSAPVRLVETPENIYVFSSRYQSVDEQTFRYDQLNPIIARFPNSSGVLVDSFFIVREGYLNTGYKHQFLFEDLSEIFALDSGIELDIPPIAGFGKVAFVEGISYRIPIARAFAKIGSAQENGSELLTGTLASDLFRMLRTEALVNSTIGSLIEEIEIGDTLPPVSMKLTSRFTGAEANRLTVQFARTTSSSPALPSDLSFTRGNQTVSFTTGETGVFAFTGGQQGSEPAYLDLYDVSGNPLVRILAVSDGAYGNNVKVSITPNDQGQFSLFVIDEDSSSYQNTVTSDVLTLSTREVDPSTGLFFGSANSRVVRAYYLPYLRGYQQLTDSELNRVPMRVAPLLEGRNGPIRSVKQTIFSRSYQGAAYLQNLPLRNGFDGPTQLSGQTAQAIKRAVQTLESEDIAILGVPGVIAGDQQYASVIEEVLGQINRATPTTGLRRAIIQAPRRLSASQAKILAASLNNPRITMVAGYISMVGVPGSNNVPSDGIYAGILASNRPSVSPASASEGSIPSGILSVDTPSSPPYLDELTRAGVEVLYYDGGLKIYKFLNGLSTAIGSNDNYVSIRQTGDQILQDLYLNLLWVRSNQNTPALRSQVATAVDAYFQSKVRDNWIAGFRPTVCGNSNNTPETIARRELNISIFYTPIFPADYINVGIRREVNDSLTLAL
ncbi:phage tail sheath C-terminal domain-containing protein [Leptolyngbya sp. AN03gr2]|uniref:phage tail sheath C-terminal domain-containing protein n=1 Tax=Leptolyngbya sp. AN03gr2 TaxID=3423364 RepID=UPI003D319AA8